MTEVKALPAPPKFLALPHYAGNLSEHFVEPEIVDQLLAGLRELVSAQVAHLRVSETDTYFSKCRAHVTRAATEERLRVYQTKWRDQLSDFVLGASLVINPLPRRRYTTSTSDWRLLQSDSLIALSDASKVWHTFSYCLEPLTKKQSDERADGRDGPKTESTPVR